MVLAEVALTLMLLVGAGLLLRSFGRLQAADLGFRPEGVLAATVTLPAERYPTPALQGRFFERAVERIAALPGVEHAGSIDALPLSGGTEVVEVAAEGRPPLPPGEDPGGDGSLVSPDYFAAMRIPLLEGRSFSARDDLKSTPVAIVSRLAAARLWPGEDAIGRRFTFGPPEARWWQVVGVVGDVRDAAPGSKPQMEVYVPQLQIPASRSTLVVRTAGDPRALVAPIRRAVQELDPDLPLFRVETLEQVVSAALAENRVKTLLLGIFAGLALVLAAAGVYGLVSRSVGERGREIGIRVALGARRDEVVRMIVGQGMRTVAAGLALGMAGAYAFGHVLAGQLYEVGAADPWTLAGAPTVLAGVALLANWLPARRATRLDVLEAFREE